VDAGTIVAALGGIKHAFDLMRSAVAARDDHKIAEVERVSLIASSRFSRRP
jgi:hypothetical protein